jgi:hypothetical protein
VPPSANDGAVSGGRCCAARHLSPVEEFDVDDGSDADVPIESALEVLDSDLAPESSSVLRRGWRTDEKLVQDFWEEIGYPTPASRFRETSASPPISSKPNDLLVQCRDEEEVAVQLGALDFSDSSSSPIIAGAQVTGEHAPRAPPSVHVRRPPRAGSWRGPCPPRWVTPLPVLGQFLLPGGSRRARSRRRRGR